jgi:hypothetical protein
MIKELGDHIAEFIKATVEKPEAWFLIVVFFGSIALYLRSFDILAIIISFIELTWWFWAFILLSRISTGVLKYWRQETFKRDIKWEILEIIVPREHTQTPKSMEQVLRAIHSLKNAPGDVSEHYFEGEVPRWFSFELVSVGGQIRLFIRFYAKQRPLIEAAFFAHYPNIELADTEDYISVFPQTLEELYEQGKDMWGTELKLSKEAAYPIVSYKDLMDEADEERYVDPFSSLLEMLGKVGEGELVGVQILAYGISDSWRKQWEPLIERLKEKTSGKKISDEEDSFSGISSRTPGETDTIRAIEKNLEKPAFNVLIRYMYCSPQETYYDSFARRGLRGSFQQYNSLGLNGFEDNSATGTRARLWDRPHVFSKKRVEMRKRRMIYNYINREIPPETFTGRLFTSKMFNWNFASKMMQLNIESFATIFHPPTTVVMTAPHIKRRESKRAGPPSGLPIFGGEENIDKFQ